MRLIIVLLLLLLSAGTAFADLSHTLADLRVSAKADLADFSVKLGARFGLPRGEVEAVISAVANPADAAAVLWLGEKSHQSRERVMEVYREHQGKGWGKMAQELGIKPGSAEFKALKAGELEFRPGRNEDDREHGHKSGHGKPDKEEKEHHGKKGK